MKQKPFAESCVQNAKPIINIIQPLLANTEKLLEIASGTGQHAVYFADLLAPMQWQCSDCRPALDGINGWLAEAAKANLLPAIELDVTASDWPEPYFDAVFTANSVHIMGQTAVEAMFRGVGKLLSRHGQFLIYGPFNYHGSHTSESNARFDQWLKQQNNESGIKHFEQIVGLAEQNGMQLENDFDMPANNRILHFSRL